jgi:MFS family permease
MRIDQPATIPRGVWALGFVSLLMDASSEMIHSVLPLFMVATLGASVFMLGVLEGVAESVALLLKLFAGALSDFIRRRKPLVVLGYGLAALSKPLFVVAHSVGMVFLARTIDRVGKGIRGAPRDALITDMTPVAVRGAAFGLRQALDTVGALLGPLLAVLVLASFTGDFALVFLLATVPAVLAVLVLIAGVREPPPTAAFTAVRPEWRSLGRLPAAFWWVAVIGGGMSLARFSEAFLILRADSLHMIQASAPLVLLVMNAVYAVTVFPLGRLSDRWQQQHHVWLLVAALSLLVAADLMLAFAADTAWLWIGVVLWGLHLGASQGLLSRMVADTAPAAQRGTAFGVFNVISGIAVLFANLVFGWLWDLHGPEFAFIAGAAVASATLLVTVIGVASRRRISEDHAP